MKKYNIEKILHELIRDLPDAAKANKAFEHGTIPLDDALKEIARIYREEREKAEQ